MSKFVTIYSSMRLPEIYIIKGILDEENIPSFTKDELITQTAPYIASNTNGIQLQVEETNIIRAIKILQDNGYIIPKISDKSNKIKQTAIFIILLLIVLLIFLWKKNML